MESSGRISTDFLPKNNSSTIRTSEFKVCDPYRFYVDDRENIWKKEVISTINVRRYLKDRVECPTRIRKTLQNISKKSL